MQLFVDGFLIWAHCHGNTGSIQFQMFYFVVSPLFLCPLLVSARIKFHISMLCIENRCSILKVGLEVRDTWTLNPNQLQQSIFKWARIVWSASAQTHYSWSDRGAFLLNANAPCKMERIDVKCLTKVLEQIHHTEWFGHIYIYIPIECG